MMRSFAIATIALFGCISSVNSLQPSVGGRRAFLSQTVSTTAAVVAGSTFAAGSAQAAPEILNTSNGVKYAVLKKGKENSAFPQKGDIVAIEYTGRYISAN
jgi:FKBP-type peptidyl-prolyl cis-trans isomerase